MRREEATATWSPPPPRLCKHTGNFGSEEEAGHAYDCAALTYRGTDDTEGLNFPMDQYSKAEGAAGAGRSTSAPAVRHALPAARPLSCAALPQNKGTCVHTLVARAHVACARRLPALCARTLSSAELDADTA